MLSKQNVILSFVSTTIKALEGFYVKTPKFLTLLNV